MAVSPKKFYRVPAQRNDRLMTGGGPSGLAAGENSLDFLSEFEDIYRMRE